MTFTRSHLTLAVAAAIATAAPSTGHAAGDPARGEYLYHAGGCESCHTAKDGAPLAGGVRLEMPFGAFVAPNITPHPQAGIGGWSEADFVSAMTEGISPEGDPYYPAFPFTSYMRMTEQDLRDLKAWLDTVAPVATPAPPHDVAFPFSLRVGLWPWRWLFFDKQPFVADPAKSDEWNRGAYLVQGPGHCGECHSPRNLLGVVDESRAFDGNDNGPDGKSVPGLRPDDNIGGWSVGDVVTILQLGLTPDGDFMGGAMTDVIKNDTSKLTDADVRAIAVYLKDLPPLD
jgi:mono/diheme cytochrome c family protein